MCRNVCRDKGRSLSAETLWGDYFHCNSAKGGGEERVSERERVSLSRKHTQMRDAKFTKDDSLSRLHQATNLQIASPPCRIITSEAICDGNDASKESEGLRLRNGKACGFFFPPNCKNAHAEAMLGFSLLTDQLHSSPRVCHKLCSDQIVLYKTARLCMAIISLHRGVCVV